MRANRVTTSSEAGEKNGEFPASILKHGRAKSIGHGVAVVEVATQQPSESTCHQVCDLNTL